MGEKVESTKWFLWGLLMLILLSVVGFGLKAAGVFGERVIFENSYQYKEARASEVATFEAQLAEINTKLRSSVLAAATRTDLESKAAAIRIQLSRARAKK